MEEASCSEELFSPLEGNADVQWFFQDLEVMCSERVSKMGSTYRDIGAVTQLLEEKENDIELAARIGKSLLERNRELQIRNDFLEASLETAEEATAQLRHSMEDKSALLRLYAEDLVESPDSPSTSAALSSLEAELAARQAESDAARAENAALRDRMRGLEEEEARVVSDGVRNLNGANKEVVRLQQENAAKSEEASQQATRIRALLADLAARDAKASGMRSEMEELVARLVTAEEQHMELQEEMLELQEKYSEVLAVLSEAQEELGHFRRASPTAPEADSLYESLASELEASDSGFYPTPSHSARSRPGFLDRSMAPPQMESLREALAALSPPRERGDSVPEDPVETPTAEAIGLPELRLPSVRPSADTSTDSARLPSAETSTDSVRLPPEASVEARRLPSFDSVDARHHPTSSDCGDGLRLPSGESLRLPSAETSGASLRRPSEEFDRDETPTPSTMPLREPSPSPPKLAVEARIASARSLGRLSHATSTDSLASHIGPALGEPGEPGTRDLDAALRRRSHYRRKVEVDYAAYRRHRGLPEPAMSLIFPFAKATTPTTPGVHKRIEVGAGTGLLSKWAELATLQSLSPATAAPAKAGIKNRSSPPRAPTLPLSPIREGRARKNIFRSKASNKVCGLDILLSPTAATAQTSSGTRLSGVLNRSFQQPLSKDGCASDDSVD